MVSLPEFRSRNQKRTHFKQKYIIFAIIASISIVLLAAYDRKMIPSSLSDQYVHRSQSQEETSAAVDRPGGFCKDIIRSPYPWSGHCQKDTETKGCRNNSDTITMYGQDKQDWYFYTQHFINLKRPGFYLDIATHHPIQLSNTFFFDRCMKWKGICVEANKAYIGLIEKERSCNIVPTCVSKDDGTTVTFGKFKSAGGIVDDNFVSKSQVANNSQALETLTCTNVKTILGNNGPRVIDFLSLDIEGHELMVLKGIDWTKTTINVMTIETYRDKEIEKNIIDYLEPFGYKAFTWEKSPSFPTGRFWRDLTIVHKDVEIGNPV